MDQVIEDDTPELVRMTAPQFYSSHPPPPPYYPYYLPAPTPAPPKSHPGDDLQYRMRPNLDSVVNRDYSQYGPLAWSWTDFTRHQRNSEQPGQQISRQTLINLTFYLQELRCILAETAPLRGLTEVFLTNTSPQTIGQHQTASIRRTPLPTF